MSDTNEDNIGSFTGKQMLNLPRQWYSNHFRYELDLLKSFIDLCSEEIDEAKIKYFYEKTTIERDFGDDYTEVIQYYKGVDDQTYHLDDIFINFFPDLKRKSNFIMVVSTLEDGLRDLCNDLSKEFSVKFNGRDPKGFLIAIKKFLKEDLNLIFDFDNDIHWKNLITAYTIRNKIVHTTNKKIPAEELNLFDISEDFIFGRDTDIVLCNEIHGFLKNLEVELITLK